MKLSPGKERGLNEVDKEGMPHEKSCIESRDEGGLIWPSKIAVFVTGIVVNFLN